MQKEIFGAAARSMLVPCCWIRIQTPQCQLVNCYNISSILVAAVEIYWREWN